MIQWCRLEACCRILTNCRLKGITQTQIILSKIGSTFNEGLIKMVTKHCQSKREPKQNQWTVVSTTGDAEMIQKNNTKSQKTLRNANMEQQANPTSETSTRMTDKG